MSLQRMPSRRCHYLRNRSSTSTGESVLPSRRGNPHPTLQLSQESYARSPRPSTPLVCENPSWLLIPQDHTFQVCLQPWCAQHWHTGPRGPTLGSSWTRVVNILPSSVRQWQIDWDLLGQSRERRHRLLGRSCHFGTWETSIWYFNNKIVTQIFCLHRSRIMM